MLAPGDRFDRYIVEALLGEGGMGRVYSAFDERLHRRVALKLVRRSEGEDDARAREAAARLLREARAAAAFAHPNVIAIHDVGEIDGTAFIAMELVDGRTLRARMAEAPALATRLRWLGDVARALAAAHRAGLVHRDVKPENVIVSNEGTVKVLDFGIARRAATGAAQAELDAALGTITREGAVIGTPLYMAPEQLENEPLDGHSDQFAWGVLAYELLAGRPPWAPSSGFAMVAEILMKEPPPLGASAPAEVEAVVLRALRKRPEERFATMDQVVEALDAASGSALGPRWAARRELSASATPELADAEAETLEAPMGLLPDASTLEAPAPALPEAELVAPPPRSEAQVQVPSAPAPAARRVSRTAWASGAALVIALAAAGVALVRSSPPSPAPAPSSSAPRAPSGAAITDPARPGSPSPEALEVYAAGVQAWRDADRRAAAKNFERAVKLDPSFAAAHLELALAMEDAQDERSASLQSAVQRRASLTERDRVLLDAVTPCLQSRPYDATECAARLARAIVRFPEDVELHLRLGDALSLAGRMEEAIAAAESALALDPKLGRAWFVKGKSQAYLGDFDGALRSFDACVRVAPAPTSCMFERLYIQQQRGECALLEKGAASALGLVPEDTMAMYQLAEAQQALGRSVDAVRITLERRRSPERIREFVRAYESARLHRVEGDFAAAEVELRVAEGAVASLPERWPHTSLAEGEMLIAAETGRVAEAGRIAAAYLKQRPAWISQAGLDNDAIEADAVPIFLAAERDAGLITAETFTREREAWARDWQASAGTTWNAYLWLFGYATTAATSSEALEALEALPRLGGLPPYRRLHYVDTQLGRTFLLAGRLDEAIGYLRQSTASCTMLAVPEWHMRGYLYLGQALEAKGDKAGACEAYAEVLKRWANARPRSLTVERVREQAKALACRP